MKNLELLNSVAYTKYSDWKGIISIDNKNLLDVQNLCKDKGIDVENYFIVGFGIDDGEDIGNPSCNVLLADKSEYGATMQDILYKTNEMPIKVIKRTFSISYNELAGAIKRLSFMALWKDAQHFEIVKD